MDLAALRHLLVSKPGATEDQPFGPRPHVYKGRRLLAAASSFCLGEAETDEHAEAGALARPAPARAKRVRPSGLPHEQRPLEHGCPGCGRGGRRARRLDRRVVLACRRATATTRTEPPTGRRTRVANSRVKSAKHGRANVAPHFACGVVMDVASHPVCDVDARRSRIGNDVERGVGGKLRRYTRLFLAFFA